MSNCYNSLKFCFLFSPIYYLFFISSWLFLLILFYWCWEHNPMYQPEETCFSFHSWPEVSISILWRNFNILLHKIILSFASLPVFFQTLPSPFPLGFFLFLWLLGGGLWEGSVWILCLPQVLCNRDYYCPHQTIKPFLTSVHYILSTLQTMTFYHY